MFGSGAAQNRPFLIMKELRKDGCLQFMLAFLLIAGFVIAAQGCAQKRYVYKVTFKNGTYDYFDLNYKPKKGATSIEYNGETIIGVDSLEMIK